MPQRSIVDCAGAKAVSSSAAFSQSEVQNLHDAAGVILMLAGFRSRWTILFLVCGVQRGSCLPGDVDHFPDRNRPAAETFFKGVAFDQLEDQRVDAGPLFHAVNGRDVRVIDCGEGTGLALESREATWIRLKRRWKDLDRHIAPELQVARAIYLPHSASTQDANHLERTDAGASSQGHGTGLGTMVIAVIVELDSATPNAPRGARACRGVRRHG